MTHENQRTKRPLRISQEMIAIVTIGVALATQQLFTAQEWRQEWRAARVAWEEESRQYYDEARADREAFRREILRHTQGRADCL